MELHGQERVGLRFVVVGRSGFAVIDVVRNLKRAWLLMNVTFVKSLPPAGRVRRTNWPNELAYCAAS